MYWVEHLGVMYEVVIEKNQLEKGSGKTEFLKKISINEFYKYIGWIISAVTYGEKGCGIWRETCDSVLVPDYNVNMFNNIPPFGTRGILTFDIAIASYTIYPFILFFLYFTLHVYPWARLQWAPHPHHHPTATGWKSRLCMGSPISWLCVYSLRGPRTTMDSTGGDTVKLSRVLNPISWRGSRARIIPICLTCPLGQGIDRIHTMLPMTRRQPPCPPGLNLGT